MDLKITNRHSINNAVVVISVTYFGQERISFGISRLAFGLTGCRSRIRMGSAGNAGSGRTGTISVMDVIPIRADQNRHPLDGLVARRETGLALASGRRAAQG